ncbi:unnamed protein product [Closterium sp. NIES-65]|nr:unnamed protein product [Closterium sp. NIES-65]
MFAPVPEAVPSVTDAPPEATTAAAAAAITVAGTDATTVPAKMVEPDAKTESEVAVGGETNSGAGNETKSGGDAKVDASTLAGLVEQDAVSTGEKTDAGNNTDTAAVKADAPPKTDAAAVADKADDNLNPDKAGDIEPQAEVDAAVADDPWAVDIEPSAATVEPAATSVPPAATQGVDDGEGEKDGEEGDVDIMDVDSSAPVAGGCASLAGGGASMIQGNKDAPPPAGAVLLGRLVRKSFGGVPYLGRVFHYDRDENWYKVRYEDGDAEDLEVSELEQLLLSEEEEKAVNADIETW